MGFWCTDFKGRIVIKAADNSAIDPKALGFKSLADEQKRGNIVSNLDVAAIVVSAHHTKGRPASWLEDLKSAIVVHRLLMRRPTTVVGSIEWLGEGEPGKVTVVGDELRLVARVDGKSVQASLSISTSGCGLAVCGECGAIKADPPVDRELGVMMYRPTKKGVSRGKLDPETRFLFVDATTAVAFKTDGRLLQVDMLKSIDSHVEPDPSPIPRLWIELGAKKRESHPAFTSNESYNASVVERFKIDVRHGATRAK